MLFLLFSFPFHYSNICKRQKENKQTNKNYPSLSFNQLSTKNPHAKNITESFRL